MLKHKYIWIFLSYSKINMSKIITYKLYYYANQKQNKENDNKNSNILL